MSTLQLPSTLDLSNLAGGTHHYAGSVDLGQFARLKSRVLGHQPAAALRLVVTVSDPSTLRRVRIVGEVQADLVMQCERCLGEVAVQVNGEFDLVAVGSEAAAEALPAEESPIIAEKQVLLVSELVEDELILALPIVAMHEPEDCPGMEWQTNYEKPHPMAALAQLKSVQDK